ncbi:FAD-dependent oxidoreductase [Cohnella zeiphila]|uniref:FAD-dependent oxidoreductase n=1 Tax=Cohnella zeiphila TaxID=2761120 RepID=A0A7X0SRJ5_9BACL|nr:FAD-dependent oxidoreductase [Cohnella zeiphila]MBB6734791.1 FAD-dependent oxidoreductase [Cohnella zeiphila]
MKCVLSSDRLPVLYEADAAVIGGSFAGIACALRLAECGLRVVVVEPRTYLGRELTATLRPWLELSEEEEKASLPDPIRHVLALSEAMRPSDEVRPLHADRLKRSLEDLLAGRSIELLYASLPTAVLERQGRTVGLEIANKSGRQAIECRFVVDATETALAAALCGEDMSRYRPGERALYRRTLEFTNVDAAGQSLGELPVPTELGLAGDRIRLLPGSAGGGHVWAEFELELPSANTLEANRDRESQARHAGMRLAVWLIRQAPAFRKADLAASSHELLGPYPLPATRGEMPFTIADCEVGRPDVVSLAKSIFAFGSEMLHDPVQASVLGRQAADAMLERVTGATDHSADEPAAAAIGIGIDASDRNEYELCVPGTDFFQRVERTIPVEARAIPVWKRTEVLVVGGGSSGASAAITAAGEGSATTLIDLNPGLGGTGTYGGVDSYWFGRKTGYAAKIAELVRLVQSELRYKGHKWNLEAKMHALLCEAEKTGADLLLNAVTCGAAMLGRRVCGAVVATRWGLSTVLASVVIDASGDGDVAAFAGAEFVYGSERDHAVMWYSLAQFKEPGKSTNNFTGMVDVSNVLDYTRAILAGRRRGEDLHDHGIYVATRESRHIMGEVVMRLTDQLLHRRWHDVINVHFSNHDVKGVSGAEWVNVGLIPPNLDIEIPYRMLLPKGLEGLLVAGKAISATHDALPAIRMQADLENLGAAAALAASMAVRANEGLRNLTLSKLQARLAAEGLIPERVLERRLEPVRFSEAELERLVDSIETEPLYEYANMRMNETYEKPIPFVEICSVGPRIVPVLERAMGRAEGNRRIRIAQALCMLQSRSGVPVLLDAIQRELQGPRLPERTADILYVQLPPDHGAMPDAAYLLYSLAPAADPRSVKAWEQVAERIDLDEVSFKDSRKGLFYYVDAVCRGAERLGSRAALPALERLHRIPLLNGQQCSDRAQADYFLERRAMLELAIGRALARCGSEEGYAVLIAYLSDNRSMLARGALLELRRLSGRMEDADPERWRRWASAEKPERQPRPLDIRLDFEFDSESMLRRERVE